MIVKKTIMSVLALLTLTSFNDAQNYADSETKKFTPTKKISKTILLLKDSENADRKIILFQTTLRVNTDGSPNSYHPQDPRGEKNAINTICNAVAVRREGSDANLCKTEFSVAIKVFEQWRDNNWIVPKGYKITWNNVLPATTKDGRCVPCVFKNGDYKGYFSSFTALTNGLPEGQHGECEIANQINPLQVPALVLVGGTNPVKDFGARVGDLVVAFNPANSETAFAVIGDTGPTDNLGEGSVALNLKLRGETKQPRNRAETNRLNIEGQGVLIAIIPATSSYKKMPFTAENIAERIKSWQTEAGFSTPKEFVEMMKKFQPKL